MTGCQSGLTSYRPAHPPAGSDSTSPGARRALHQRYQRLLLDEFQDTDPIQIELAVLIAAAIDGDEPPSWDQIPVEDGRLFFVGDPKQSIYRFRRADVALYEEVKERLLAAGAELVHLSRSMRAAPGILEAVNHAFAPRMKARPDRAQAGYVPLEPSRREPRTRARKNRSATAA